MNFNLVHQTKVSTERKLNVILIDSIHSAFLSQVFLFCLKRNSSKILKSSDCKNLFFSVYVVGTTCFSEYFLFRVITGKNHFLWNFIITLRLFSNRHVAASLKQMLWKKSVFYVISTMLTPNFQKKLSYIIIVLFS